MLFRSLHDATPIPATHTFPGVEEHKMSLISTHYEILLGLQCLAAIGAAHRWEDHGFVFLVGAKMVAMT